MRPETPYWIGAGILVAAALVAVRPSSTMPMSYQDRPVGTGWADGDAPRRIRQIAAPIERLAHWPGLGDFLVATAWRESRGNPRAANPSGAKGWFQLFAQSARVRDLGYSSAVLTGDERMQVALAAWYAYRLRPYATPNQNIDWSAISRGWAYPSLVDDVHLVHERSRANLRRFLDGVTKAGLSESFMRYPAFPTGFNWPGIDAVLAAVGRTRAA